LVLAGAALSLLAASPAFAQGADKIRLGFITTSSGPVAVLGKEQMMGLDLALKKLDNKLGGIPVEVFREDAKMTTDTAQQATAKLVENHKIDFLVGNMLSHQVLAYLKPVTDSGAIILSSISGPSKVAGEECNPNFFAYSWENNAPSESTGQLMTNMGSKKAFFLAQNYVTGKEHAEGAKHFYKGQVVGEAYVPIPQVDYAAEIASIRASGADSVFVFLPGAGGIAFVKQFANSGLKDKVKLMGGSWLADEHSFEALGDTALGLNLAAPWFPQLDNPTNKAFVADFQKEYGRLPVFYSAFVYDSMMALDAAVKAAGGAKDKAKVRAELEKANFKSIRGDSFKMNVNHFPIQNYYSAEVVKKDGKLEHKVTGTIFKDQKDRFFQACKMKKG
jgi:branched-chain amino acid transport system substrate-binding protein